MARTNAVVRGYINRIIEIRKMIIPKLTREVIELGDKLGEGTFRSSTYPGMKIQISGPRNGHSVAWKAVCDELAARYNIPSSEVMATAMRHRSYTHQTQLSITVAQDKAVTPKGAVV